MDAKSNPQSHAKPIKELHWRIQNTWRVRGTFIIASMMMMVMMMMMMIGKTGVVMWNICDIRRRILSKSLRP